MFTLAVGETDKEKPFHPAMTKKIPLTALFLLLTALSHVQAQLKQAWTVWIRRLFVSRRVYPRRELPFTPFNCYSFPLSLASPRHNALPLCSELEPLCGQTFSRPYPDLSSLWFYAHTQIHFSSFIRALVHITCLFYFNVTK